MTTHKEECEVDHQALMNAVDEFAIAMKEKLSEKLKEGWDGWAKLHPSVSVDRAYNHLRRLDKGEVRQDVDVANFMMFHYIRRNTQ